MTSAFAEAPQFSRITARRATGPVVVRPAPPREPPYDDELVGAVPGPHERPLPFERGPRRHAIAAVVPPLRRGLPEPGPWGQRLLIGVIETAAGRRPLNQLLALVSPGVAHGLRSDFERAALRGRPHWTHAASVRSVRASEPAENIAELSATVRTGTRVRAVAMRLEVRHGRWCCTRLVLG